MAEWQFGKPPHDTFVTVELDGKLVRAKAVWGGDGYRPHWRTEDGTCYPPETFSRWLPI